MLYNIINDNLQRIQKAHLIIMNGELDFILNERYFCKSNLNYNISVKKAEMVFLIFEIWAHQTQCFINSYQLLLNK